MKIFLTGGRGMVGRNVLAHSSASKYNIIAPTSKELDLTDRAAVFHAIDHYRPDMVIHSAGKVGGIQANIKNPVGFLIENLDMGINIVNASAAAGVERVINLGSSCMYPRNGTNPLAEETILTGELEPTNEGYALAKIAVLRLCQYMHSMHENLAYKTMIPCNIYGLYDKFDPTVSHLLPAIIRKVHEAKRDDNPFVEIWGDGTARREFMFGSDLADAIWYGVENYDAMPDMMNVGVGQDYTINEYYETVAEVLKWTGQFTHDRSKPVGMQRKMVSTQRQEAFGWQPKTSLRDGVAQTYAYFLQFLQ